MGMKKTMNRILCAVLSVSMVVATLGFSGLKAEAKADPKQLKNPRHIHSSEDYPAKDRNDCVYVTFGSFPQTKVTEAKTIDTVLKAAGGKNGITVTVNKVAYYVLSDWKLVYKVEPIKWRVLRYDEKANKALLMADNALVSYRFSDIDENEPWVTSTLRSNLNGYGASMNAKKVDYSADKNSFWNMAFTTEEKYAIVTSTIKNPANPKYNISSGTGDTSERVFLLSSDDIENEDYGFCDDYERKSASRQVYSTDYAKDLGMTQVKKNQTYSNNMEVASWLLRTAGSKKNRVSYVDAYGEYKASGVGVFTHGYGVVPALYLDTTKVDLYEIVNGKKSSGKIEEGTIHTVGEADYLIKLMDNKYGDYEVYYADNYDFKTDKITIPASVKIGDKTFKVTGIASGAFNAEDKKLKTVVFPKKQIKVIEEGAFENCASLRKVMNADYVTTVGDDAFYGCTKLTTIDLKRAQTIGKRAFYACKSITKFTVGSKVTSIGASAFAKTSSMKKMIISSTKLKESKVGAKAFASGKHTVVYVVSSRFDKYSKFLHKKGLPSKCPIYRK